MSDLFLEILNTGIMAGWLVLAVLIARVLLKNAPAWAKCALWAIVGARLIWPFEIESILSLIPSAQTLPPAALYDPTPEIHTGIAALNSTINPTFTQTFAPEPAASINPLQTAVAVASMVWVIGMIAMASYTAISYLRLRRRVRVSMPAGEEVYLCDHIASPFILGLIKPKIYLPSDLPKEKWDSILAHERAHLARRDHWWKPLGFALLTVFWFHPLLWLAYILLCRDVELACDERVIRTLSAEEKQNYSATLLECSVPRKWITACPLAFGETGVKQRIKAVLHYKKPTLWIIIAALIVCSVLAVCFLTEPQTSKPQFPQGTYATGEMVNEVINTGWWADVSGTFRITDEGVLQFDPATERPNDTWKDESWQDLGVLEEFTLTEENFDDLFVDKERLAETLLEIRQNNTTAWRVPSDYGKYHYFLLQNDGTCYFMYGSSWLYQLGRCDFAGKQYVYTKPGAGSEFYINIYANGRFQYYAGNYSSHIGMGDWELKDGKLYLYDTTLTDPMTFVFAVGEEQLTYIAAESHPFMYVDVSDGDIFRYYAEIDPPEDTNTISQYDLIGKALTYEYESRGYMDRFTVYLNEDGTCTYHTSMVSSIMHSSTWRLEGGKLYIGLEIGNTQAAITFRVGEDGTLYKLDYPEAETSLIWVQVLEEKTDEIICLDSEGNRWRVILPVNIRLDLDHTDGGIWVRYYGEPKELTGEDTALRYEVIAQACWQFVENNALSEGKDLWPIYDYCLYDFDNDGVVEECIVSMGYTSGMFTIYFSTWENGECEEGRLIYTSFAEGYAFCVDENGLFILSNEGDRIYPGLYSNGFVELTPDTGR